MTQLKPTLKRAVMGILLVPMIACPLTFAAGVVTVSSEPLAQGPIQFTPDVAPLVTEEPPDGFLPEELVLPEAFVTPIPTLGPGQYFEETDSNRPEVGEVHGNDDFGWGKVKGQPGLILMWVTDHEGTHYVTVGETSDLFLGTPDPATNSRLEDGFDDYIGQLDILQRQRVATGAEGIASGAAIAVLAWGIGLCPATGGGGCVAGVVGAIAVAVGNAVRDHIILAGLNGELRTLQSSASDVFNDALAAGQP